MTILDLSALMHLAQQLRLTANQIKRRHYLWKRTAANYVLVVGTGTVCVPLSQGKHALIEAQDYPAVHLFAWRANLNYRNHGHEKWYAHTTGYDSRGKYTTMLYMHAMIAQPKDGEVVDHRNGDTLDNQRLNLRCGTQRQNSQNRASRVGSSRFKGVMWSKRHLKWQAMVSTDGRGFVIDLFDTELDAAKAYDWGAAILFGDYADLNFKDHAPTEPNVARKMAGYRWLKWFGERLAKCAGTPPLSVAIESAKSMGLH